MLTAAELDVKEYTVRFCGSAPGVAAAVSNRNVNCRREEWRRHIPWIASAGGILVALQSIAEKALPAVGGKKEESVVHLACDRLVPLKHVQPIINPIIGAAVAQDPPACPQLAKRRGEERSATDPRGLRIGALIHDVHDDGDDGDGDGDGNGDGGDSGGEKLAGELEKDKELLNCKNMVTIPGLKRNYTNGMENKFSVPRQRIRILLREKPQTRKCSVEIGIKRGNTGRLQCEVAREVYTGTNIDDRQFYNIQIDNRGNAILHRTLIQACKRVDEPRVALRRTITLRSELLSKLYVLGQHINCSFESVTYLKNAFLEKCLRQKNISELRD
ncbi:hypothetical protein ALC56_13375 [Trachymyrmex septentrionalis]|uniref:Uncharacterized protein n=1 Tax=Trachymyrmex septentrionalis TaxID=34720 RepID=A0A195EX90_9HYME|nr:hypothetical protein ALC56_13375 [Trachymyrmex septentrionalis]